MRFSRPVYLVALLGSGAVSAQFLPQVRVTPNQIVAESGDTTLTVTGLNFTPTVQVQWNGQSLATQYISSVLLKATVPQANLATPALAQVALFNPDSGVAASDPVSILVYLQLASNDLIADPLRTLLYASVSKQDPDGPSIAIIDPNQGAIKRYIPLPDEPGVLAISDNSNYLYVALPDRIRRMDLTGATSDLDILLSTLPRGNDLILPVLSILPLPGRGTSFVVSVGSLGEAPGVGAVYVVDGAQPRPGYATSSQLCLCGSPDGTSLYIVTRSTLSTFTISDDGLPYGTTNNITILSSAFACPVYANGTIYGGGGEVVDPAGPTLLSRFGAWGLVSPAPELNRTYFIGGDSAPDIAIGWFARIMVFDNNTLQLVQSLNLPITSEYIARDNLFYGRLVHWGSNGVAFMAWHNAPAASSLYLFHVPGL